MDIASHGFQFVPGDVALGACAALALGALLRIRLIALALAVAVAAAIVFALLHPAGPKAAAELATARLSDLARSGVLLGFSLASTVGSILRSAAGHARSKRPRRGRARK